MYICKSAKVAEVCFHQDPEVRGGFQVQRGESIVGQGSSLSKAPEVEKTCAHWIWIELGFESLEVGISERWGGKSGREEAEDCFECRDMEVGFII